MDDFNELKRRDQELQQFSSDAPKWLENYVENESIHVGQWIVVPKPEKKEKGFLVKTKFGIGRTKHSDEPIQGKIPVYLDNGQKVLLNPKNIKLTGFID